MSERKVLTKYYPPDFDPSKITRTPKHLRPSGPKLLTVRLMAPFSMRCTSCGEYIYKGRKFNARKETTDEKYLAIAIYRFYIRCTRCSGEITFKTDPKNMDYTCEKGAKRNFEPWRNSEKMGEVDETDEERLDRLEREEKEGLEMEERDKMEELERKMGENQREMRVADALDEIRTRNARIERGERGNYGVEGAMAKVRDEVEEERERQRREDEELARRAYQTEMGEKVKRLVDEEDGEVEGGVNGAGKEAVEEQLRRAMPPPTFTGVKKPKKPVVAALGIKKPEKTSALVGYGSDSD